MARSFSTEQEDILSSPKYQVFTRLEVADSTGAFIDIGTLGGANWFEGARWDWSLDQPVPEITLKLRRDQGPSTGESLSPLDEDSTFNVDASTAYAPLLDVGREIRFYTATVAAGAAAPATSELDWVFQGEIDDVKWPKSPIELVARSKIMSRLHDQWVETETTYGSVAGIAIQTVMQSILDDHTDLGITLSVPSSPGFDIKPAYNQQKASVLDALTVLAQLIGWQIREVFSSTEWVLELSEPRRTATSSETDWTFGPNDYFDVRGMAISRDDVRNAVSVLYGPNTSSGRIKELVESTSSIDKFGRRWMEVEEGAGSPIDTSSEANTLANSILSDLDTPPATHEIEVPYWWPGELGDYYAFEANDIHYSVDQFLGVYGISHTLERERHRTSIRVRGQPAGQYLQWQKYPGGGNPAIPEISGIEIAFNPRGHALVSASANDATADMYVTVGDGTDPADPSTASSVISGKEGTVDTGTKITIGNLAHVKVVAADGAAAFGFVKSVQHQRALGPFHKDTSVRATSSTSDVTLETITIPADSMGIDGLLRITLAFELNGVADAKTITVSFGGTLLFTTGYAAANNQALRYDILLSNDGNDSVQTTDLAVLNTDTSGSNQVIVARGTSAIDTTADRDIVITGQVDSTGDEVELLFSMVEFAGTK